MTTDSKCPRCGDEMDRDDVDVGVGVIYGPWGCGSCGYSEHEQAGQVIDGRYHDIYGGSISVERIVEGAERFGLGDLARAAFDGAHTLTFDPHHGTWRCLACGAVCPAPEDAVGPCSPPPSRWVPPGASEPEPAGYLVTPQLLDAGYLPDAGDEYPPEWDEPDPVEPCCWPGPCPAGECSDCDARDADERADDDNAYPIAAMLERAGERYRASLAEPLVEDDALCAVLPQCEVGGCEGTAVASYGGTLVCEEHDPQSKADTETLGLPGLDGGGE